MNNLPLVVVDVQPCYHPAMSRSLVPDLVMEVEKRCNSGQPVWLLFNNEELSGDTLETVQDLWHLHGLSEDAMDACRWLEKSYAFLRGWMDNGIDEDEIVSTLRHMNRRGLYDSRDLSPNELRKLSDSGCELADPMWRCYDLEQSGLSQLDALDICGGGRNECLREVELWLMSHGVNGHRIDHLTY